MLDGGYHVGADFRVKRGIMVTDSLSSILPVYPLFENPKRSSYDPDRSTEQRERSSEGKKLKIIVIDDEEVIAATVVEILNQEGFEATAVSDGVAAIKLARDLQPNVVLSDVIMPGLDGVETGIRLREIVPNCKIILFSGQAATVDLLEKARRQWHHFDILAKPVKPEQLISVIRAGSRYRA
jgi:CheY-like chemotaxis protein